MPSIMKLWTDELPLRHQGVLLVAVRGCDNAPKENSAKPLVRALRYAFMNPADEREVNKPSGFFASHWTERQLVAFLKDWDHYPIHFIQHLMHGIQVIGYKHPDTILRHRFLDAYLRIVKKLHLMPENEKQMDARLCEDRIALYGAANAPE